MEEREQVDEAAADQVLPRRAADLGDAGGIPSKQLGREVAKRADDARLNKLYALRKPGPAGVDLVRLRVAVPRGPAQKHVVYEDVLARHPDPLEQLGQEGARTPDEGQALTILLRPGGLADEHQVRVGVARAEDDPVAGLGKGAELADRSLVVDLDQCLAAVLGIVHELLRRLAADRSAARCRAKRSVAPSRSMPRVSSSPRLSFGVSWRWSGAYELESNRSTSADPHSGQTTSEVSRPTCDPTSSSKRQPHDRQTNS